MSPEEGAILWKDGSSDAQAGLCADAVPKLTRFVDRYPGHEGYVRAHLLLGECLYRLGDFKEAIRRLQYFTSGSANENPAEALELFQKGRVALGWAYLAADRGNEAYLTSLDIAKRVKKDEATSRIALQGLLIKARALVLLKQDAKAEKTVDSVIQRLSPDSDAELRGEAAWVRMKLVSRRCTQLPGKGGMDEAQARDQLRRRGSCMLEATVLAREALISGQEEWARKAELETRQASSGFRAACATPPPPAKIKRSKTELQKYNAELADVLAKDCAKTLRGAVSLVEGWNKDVPPVAQPYLAGMRDAFKADLVRLDRP